MRLLVPLAIDFHSLLQDTSAFGQIAYNKKRSYSLKEILQCTLVEKLSL